MTSQTRKQTIAIHILTNISRSKGNQAMKFSQLVEYNMRNIFLEKPSKKWDGETNPRRYSKKSKLSISLDQQPMILYRYFSLYREILGNMCNAIVCWPSCRVANFKINLILLIKPFFLYDQKVKTKI